MCFENDYKKVLHGSVSLSLSQITEYILFYMFIEFSSWVIFKQVKIFVSIIVSTLLMLFQ